MATTRIGSTGVTFPDASVQATSGVTTVNGKGPGVVESVLITSTAVASNSGTNINFTSIPSWVKRITIMLNGVSTNGGSGVIAQLGIGSTPTYITTGYVSGSSSATTTNGLWVHAGINQADTRLGSCVITNFGGNIWNSSAVGGFGNGAGTSTAGGYISLGATLTALRITSGNNSDTFDAGFINIMYE